jgi:hypothetical protein
MKILKISFSILFLLAILFFGGAIILPPQQEYVTILNLKSDPVAVYSKLSQLSLLKMVSPYELSESEDSIIITRDEEYKSIHYSYLSSNQHKSYKGGFNIEKENQGTKVTWFFMKDSLSFPLNRWRGFFEAKILEEKIQHQLKDLEEIIYK